jgi:hypothetical protein
LFGRLDEKPPLDYQEVTTEITRLQGIGAKKAMSAAIEFHPKSFQYPAKKESRLLTGGLAD